MPENMMKTSVTKKSSMSISTAAEAISSNILIKSLKLI
jgi:hypothetical protein